VRSLIALAVRAPPTRPVASRAMSWGHVTLVAVLDLIGGNTGDLEGQDRGQSPVLLAIFGAGASYDSSPTHRPGPKNNDRPPLADELFEERPRFSNNLRRFPECLGLIPNLRHRHPSSITVEQELDRLLQEAEYYPARRAQLMAIRYYLHLTLYECINYWVNVHGGVENYAALLDHIEQWRGRRHGRVVLVTFNYDTMIENALLGREVIIRDIDGYVTDDRYKLVKVHGSVNWARDVTAPSGLAHNPGALIQAASDLRFCQWWITSEFPVSYVQTPTGTHVPAVPAIALPLQMKTEFECPPPHLDVLKQHLPEVTKCLVIGWRGNEPHFTSVLREGLKRPIKWMVAAGETHGTEVTQNLQKERLTGEFTDSNLAFSDFIIQRKAYEFLSD